MRNCSASTANRHCANSGASVDADGTRHYRYQQYFRGIPVWGEHVVVAEDSRGNLKSLFGRSVGGLAMEIPVRAPVVGANNALAAAKKAALGNRACGDADRKPVGTGK